MIISLWQTIVLLLLVLTDVWFFVFWRIYFCNYVSFCYSSQVGMSLFSPKFIITLTLHPPLFSMIFIHINWGYYQCNSITILCLYLFCLCVTWQGRIIKLMEKEPTTKLIHPAISDIFILIYQSFYLLFILNGYIKFLGIYSMHTKSISFNF